MSQPSDQPPDQEAAVRAAQLRAQAADDYADRKARAAEARGQLGHARTAGNTAADGHKRTR